MFRRMICAVAILIATLCFSFDGNAAEFDYKARNTDTIGNGNGRPNGFHEPVWTIEPPPTQPVKPPPIEPFTPSIPSETYGANDTWLIQWYLCGTDLESTDSSDGGASRDLKEMLKVKLPPNVKVLIQTGGTEQWQNSAFAISNNAIERFLYTSDGIQKVQSLPDADMGDPNTLADFLSYGEQNYPADHRVFIFWDHGRVGVGGICKDERYGDNLSLNDLDEAFTKVYTNSPNRKPFEVIAFDTCIASTYEYANSIHKFGRYMVASEPLVPSCGLYYTGWLGALAANPAMNGRELGIKICDTFMEGVELSDSQSFIDSHEAWESTMSVIDLAAIPALGKAYEDFGNEALARAKQNPGAFYVAFGRAAMSNNTERYSHYNENSREVEIINHVDLLTFANEIKRQNVLTNTPDALAQAVRNAVVYNEARGRNYKKGGGIAAYHHYGSAGGNFRSYEQQTPAPAPQKQFYGQLIRSHLNISQSLADEEKQNLATTAASDQKADLAKQNTGSSTATGQQANLAQMLAQNMTPEEIDRYKKEFAGIERALKDRGALPENKSLFKLTPAEQAELEKRLTPEETAQILNIYVKIMEKAQESFDVDIERDGTLSAQFTPEQLKYITSVRFMVCQGVEHGTPDIGLGKNDTAVVYLGTGTDVKVDWQEGKFTGTFPKKWPTLNGVPIYIQVTNENAEYDANNNIIGGYNRYIVPIKLNGEECSMEVSYDFTDKQYYLLRVMEGLQSDGTVSRSSIAIKKGDVITPLLFGWFLNKDRQLELKKVDSTKTITVDNRLTIQDTPLKDGQYAYFFQFVDFVNTIVTSKTFSVELDDGDIYANVTETTEPTPEISVSPEGNIAVDLPEEFEE